MIILGESETFAPKNVDEDSRISASDMLKTFCKWQSHQAEYFRREERREYDVALLLTRYQTVLKYEVS